MDGKKVVLFSGGLDSYCLAHIVKPDVLLMFDLGTDDNVKELDNLSNMPFKLMDKVTIEPLNLEAFELPNKIIPHRNTILALLASKYGNRIYMGATKGDTTKDKDYVWVSQVEGILNYFTLDTHKTWQKVYPYHINLPFKGLSKAQILKLFIEENGNVSELLKHSRSCYSRNFKECGVCRSCLRKAVAFELNDINYDKHFSKHPLENITKENNVKMLNRPFEVKDYIKAIKKYDARKK